MSAVSVGLCLSDTGTYQPPVYIGGAKKLISPIRVPVVADVNSFIETALLHTHTHTPVSYTHLDVYKRQTLLSLWDNVCGIIGG